jgi:hypothetical protein
MIYDKSHNGLLAGIILSAAATILFQPAAAQGNRYLVYNNTSRTDFTGLYMAPAGTQNWGPNQTLNDKDKSVEAGERLKLTGLSPGRFSVKLVDRKGRTCILPSVDLTKENSFEIRDNQLSHCR